MAAISNGNKAILREQAIKIRSKLSSSKTNELSEIIADQLINNFKFKGKNVHLFFPIKGRNEVNTWHLYNLIKEISKIHTSKANSTSDSWESIKFKKDSNFTTTKFNVPIPITYESSNWDEIDIIIVPLLAFDNLGNRVGYGKGIYDSILEKTRKNCIKIGVSFFKCSPLSIDSEPHDISLNYCQTPYQLNCFN